MNIVVDGIGHTGQLEVPIKGRIGTSTVVVYLTGMIRITHTQKVVFARVGESFDDPENPLPSCISGHLQLTEGWKVLIRSLSDPNDRVTVEAYAS